METFTSPLVLTKICVPASRPRIIPRTRLIDLVTLENGKDSILVCAPAGYGKTTFLVDWAQSQLRNGRAVAWVGLDPSDDVVISFCTYLIASLVNALKPTPEFAHIAQLLRASPETDLQRIIESVINAVVLSNQDCVLILDDYHLITSPAIHSAVSYLIEHKPINMCIVIGSRSDPPLPLARLRAGGHLLEIRAADLRFTTDETVLFLNKVMKLNLSSEGIIALEERTEGWIAGLQLAALSLSGRPDKEDFIATFAGSHRYLVDYLLEEVFNRQTQEVQSFLLSSSILERICAPLCDAILGLHSHSETILNQLDQTNLFIVPLDDQGYWYRYHHLFRDFLQTRLFKKEPERVTALHKAASEWLVANNFLREAAQQAFQIHDWEYAAAFVEQHSFAMIIHSEISTLYEWCSAFPEKIMQAHPLLCIHQCWGLVFSFRRQYQPRIEERLQQAGQIIAVMEDKQQAHDLTENITVIRTFLAMTPDPSADPQGQLTLSQSMLGTYPEGDPGQFSALLTIGYAHMALYDVHAATIVFENARQIALRGHLFFGVVESTFHLSRLAHNQGRLQYAAQLCRQGQTDIASMLTRPEQDLPASGCLDIALGCVLLEQNHLVEAEKRLLHGLELIGIGMNPYYLMTGYVALARLYEIQDRLMDAETCLVRLEETWPDIAFFTEGLRVVFALRTVPETLTTLAEAADWSNRFSSSLGNNLPSPGMGPFGAAEVYYLSYLIWFRILIAIGKSRTALTYIERQLNPALTNGIMNRVIELSLLEAQAAQAEGKDKQSREALERALVAAQPAGYIHIFNQGPTLTKLLIQADNKGICQNYIGQILAVIGLPNLDSLRNLKTVSSTFRTPDFEIIENLTSRESEVLHLVAQGATNETIAEQLVITIGTVKSHINHILRKLNAHNRTEVVARARRLGLV
ncbi:MAG: LuxR C-terminal-related transcriptional regulator [Flexilinea sp.]